MAFHPQKLTIAGSATLVAILITHSPAYAAHYYVTDLGTLGGTESYAWDLNAGGQVVGYATTADDATVDAFLWSPTNPNAPTGSMIDMGTLGGTYAWGVGINTAGQVAGVSATPGDAAEHATLWKPTSPNNSSGTLHDLGTLGGTYSQANAINTTGLVTGLSDTPDDVDTHAFLWKPTTPGGTSGALHDLGSLGGPFTVGWDINDNGQVVGTSDVTDLENSGHAFLWQPNVPNGISGIMHDLGTLGGSTSNGAGVNNLGQIAGSADTLDDAATHAFLWNPSSPGGTAGAMLDLGTLGGLNSYGSAVGAAGQVVGTSEVDLQVSTYTHAFLHAAGGMVDLNTLINPFSGWELLDAMSINNVGQIAGQGLINGEYHAYLLTPVLAGDVNADGIVNGQDIALIASNWLNTGTTATGDANYDGIVNGQDIALVASNWLQSVGNTANASAVPEPASLCLLVIAVLGLMAVHRRLGQGNTRLALFVAPAVGSCAARESSTLQCFIER